MNKKIGILLILIAILLVVGMIGVGGCCGVGGLTDNDRKIMHDVVVDDKTMADKKIGDVPEMVSVLSDMIRNWFLYTSFINKL